jgi:hypothetical protein
MIAGLPAFLRVKASDKRSAISDQELEKPDEFDRPLD